MTDAALAIEVRDLTRRYGRRRGIEQVTFDVREGEVFGFLGPNGSGKTTTLRLLMGFLRPTSGSARVFGRDVWSEAPAVHRETAFLGSDPGFLGELTAARQLDDLAAFRGLPAGVWRPLAERLSLDVSVPVRKLSRGNRQKIGVAAAFMGRERLLLLDEPTAGLDPLLQREFLTLLAEVRSAGRTVLLSSHNLPEVERASDRVAIIREGRIVEISTVSDLLGAHWRDVTAVLGQVPPADAFALPNVHVLSQGGHDIHLTVQGDPNPLLRRLASLDVLDIAITTPDIEDVFLRYYDDRARPAEGAPGLDGGHEGRGAA